jgi:hypothetical protein
MAISYPGYEIKSAYNGNPSDILAGWDKGFAQGKDERQQKDSLKLIEEYFGQSMGGAQPPQAIGGNMVGGSVDAAQLAREPKLQASLDARYGAQPQGAGMDQYLASAKMAESSGNRNAKNSNSSATGLYQFLDGTWNDLANKYPELGLTPDGRTDPMQQEKAMRAFTADNAKALSSSGIAVNPTSLYAAHFLGAGGAQKVLSASPDTPMSALVSPDVLQANPQIAQMRQGDFVQWASGKAGGMAPTQTSAQSSQPMTKYGVSPELLTKMFANPNTRDLALSAIKTASAGTDQPAAVKEYLFAVQQGYGGSFSDWQRENKSGATVNVNTGENSGAFAKKSDELAAARLDEIVKGGQDAQTFTGDLMQLSDIAKTLKTGKEAEFLAAVGPFANALGISTEGLSEAQAYDAIVSRMAPAMRIPGSGASSDFDARQFLKSLPALGNTPDGNALIIQTFTNIQNAKMNAAEIASQAQMGQISWQEADKQIRALGNPFQAFKEATAQTRKSGGVDTAADAPPANWPGDPDLWEFMTPEERALWN